QDQVDHKSRLLAEDDVQHLLVRAGLHDRTDAGDLHAQEGKQYRRHHGAGDAGQAITSEELQDLVAGGKATANDHGHIGQGDLPGMLVHLLISTCWRYRLPGRVISGSAATTDISARMSDPPIPASTGARAGATPSGSPRSHTAFMPAKSRAIFFR